MITVITPVFNAEKFFKKNIESVLSQKEVSEHILIDDGSTDNSWKLILDYANIDKRIVLLQHSDKRNHGRSSTRNLGIINARNDIISFLDADDYYLENRFKNDSKLFLNRKDVDGVYNAIGIHFYDNYKGDKNIAHQLTTIKKIIPPELLFENMSPIGKQGWFSGNGFTIKKKALIEVGMFNEKLNVAEDTELWVKLALKYKLVGGDIIKPVAIRGVHSENVFYRQELYDLPRLLMFQSLLLWSIKNDICKKRVDKLTKLFIKYLQKIYFNDKITYSKFWIITLFKKLKLLYSREFLKGIIWLFSSFKSK